MKPYPSPSDSNSESDLVVAYPRRANASEHEVASQEAMAVRLAALLGRRFEPDYRPSRRRDEPPPYYVPDRTSSAWSARPAWVLPARPICTAASPLFLRGPAKPLPMG